MRLRYLVDGREVPDAKERDELHARDWYLHLPDGDVVAFTSRSTDNLLSAVTRSNDIRRFDGDVWLSTDAEPPVAPGQG